MHHDTVYNNLRHETRFDAGQERFMSTILTCLIADALQNKQTHIYFRIALNHLESTKEGTSMLTTSTPKYTPLSVPVQSIDDIDMFPRSD